MQPNVVDEVHADSIENQKLIEEAGVPVQNLQKKEIKTDYDREPLVELRVSADPTGINPDDRKKQVKKLAGAIAHSLRTSGEINVRCFGNNAIAKGAKALAIAKTYIKATHKNLQLSFSPAFINDEIGGNKLTGVSFCTFSSEVGEEPEIDTSKVESQLFVKADHKDATLEQKRVEVRKLAGAIAKAVEEHGECTVRAFGSAAIGKASKALVIARGFTATRGPDLYAWSSFIVAEMHGSERTGISFYCYDNK